jgi:hypothetical protein
MTASIMIPIAVHRHCALPASTSFTGPRASAGARVIPSITPLIAF